ncbi:hypothetical protein GRF29_1g3309996 [Pseudopithomyces chartarum]|uniref:Solute carrier family 66 member 3 n=1 Tax=Pseudopithomyces chartarum TaxID=1892770 RepID=A0AAN6MA95_9PLEO|nr:hypothetical protein GRF29_1g3309996 [Pseudopithomyces chartarum]
MDALRSTLQPITHNLPAPLVSTGRSLLGPLCYKTLILDIDPFTHPTCLKLAISKGLGIGIIAASSIVKIPQLLKILNAQSADGISFLAYLLESGSYLISLAYNVRHGFPFSTYGETALILVQNVVIAGEGGTGQLSAFAVSVLLFSGFLQWGMWVEANIQQVINYLLGSLSRIFTTLQEVPDPLILYNFIAGFVLNAILALQMALYWNSPASKKTESKKLNKGYVAAGKGPSSDSSAKGAQSYASATKAKSPAPTTRRRG